MGLFKIGICHILKFVCARVTVTSHAIHSSYSRRRYKIGFNFEFQVHTLSNSELSDFLMKVFSIMDYLRPQSTPQLYALYCEFMR